MANPDSDDKNGSDLTSFEHWRRKAAWITGLGLSAEDVKRRDEIQGLQREEKDWKKCEKWKQQLWQTSASDSYQGRNVKTNARGARFQVLRSSSWRSSCS